jgi:protein involved in polysaccharide export with SLBB domain
MYRSNLAAFLTFAFFGSALSSADATGAYPLGTGDHIEVRVSDFRAGTGEVNQWTIYQTGTPPGFVVGPDGKLSLPVLGELDAAGKTTTELEKEIATRLQRKVGLATCPDASVQIIKFRPFYIVGAVDKPGEYEYRPGLTVLQALSLAGGLQRVTTDQLLGFEKDALSSRGELRVLAVDRISLLARQARLDAEIADKREPTFPDELTSKSGDPDVAHVLREEQLLFDARRDGLSDEVKALEQSKAYLRNEIAVLQQKSTTIDAQLAAMRKELQVVTGLLSKGLTAAPRQLELEQNIAQIENNQLDVQVAIVRDNEDIAKSDRDILDLKAKFRKDVLQEAAEVQERLAETAERIQTAQTLINQAEVRAPNVALAKVAGLERPTYILSRRGNDGQADNLPARESDLVQPGDVVRVIPQIDRSVTSASTAN